MYAIIREKLVSVHLTCECDKFGQMSNSALSVNNVFGEDTEILLDYLKDHKNILKINWVTNGRFEYRKITEILDADIKYSCKLAFRINKNRLRNLNAW